MSDIVYVLLNIAGLAGMALAVVLYVALAWIFLR